MPNNNPTTMPEWAIDALRELIDIAGLLNDEMFLAVETFDAREMIVGRLRSLAETITLTSGEPHIESDGPANQPA